MPRVRCRACEGTYQTDQGGARYFHVCPDVVAGDPLHPTPRPGARNENIRLNRDGTPAGAIADGDGTDPVDNGA
jgi:hypothetical protein